MTKDATEFVQTCNTGCAPSVTKNSPPPMVVREIPDRPGQHVAPSQLMMNRSIRTRIPQLIKNPSSRKLEEARLKDQETRLDRKEKLDLRKTAKNKEVSVGDKVLLSQRKSTTKPPYDPRPFEVIEIKGTQVTAERGFNPVSTSRYFTH